MSSFYEGHPMTEGIRLEKEVQVPVLAKEEYVWLQAWLSVARSDNCVSKSSPTSWADQCLVDFKSRFEK